MPDDNEHIEPVRLLLKKKKKKKVEKYFYNEINININYVNSVTKSFLTDVSMKFA